MQTKEQIIKNLNDYISNKIDELSINNSIVMVFRPVLHKISKKVVCKVDKLMDLIVDENGMIDVETLLTEMANNLVTASNKSYPDILDGITIGNGKISIGIPLIDKELILTKEDIEEIKNYLIR